MAKLSKKIGLATIASISASLVLGPACTAGMADGKPASAPKNAATHSKSLVSKKFIYADGVYTATGQYGNLPSSITVTTTLAGDIIKVVKVTPHATDPTSLDLQQRFAAAIPAVVVGKRIDEVKIDRLAGSSGTPKGFNAAIQKIKEQAKGEPKTAK